MLFSTDGCCTELLLVVVKYVKCFLFWYHTVTICTVVCWHDIAYIFVNIWSAPAVQCVRLLLIVISVNECCTSSPVHAQLLLIVIKCVKCRRILLFWYHTVTICTIVCHHGITYIFVYICVLMEVHNIVFYVIKCRSDLWLIDGSSRLSEVS